MVENLFVINVKIQGFFTWNYFVINEMDAVYYHSDNIDSSEIRSIVNRLPSC